MGIPCIGERYIANSKTWMMHKVLWKCAFYFILWGNWNEHNIRLFRQNYLSFKLSNNRVIFLASLWASAIGTFRGISITNLCRDWKAILFYVLFCFYLFNKSAALRSLYKLITMVALIGEAQRYTRKINLSLNNLQDKKLPIYNITRVQTSKTRYWNKCRTNKFLMQYWY